jgi:hypothetical protein
MWPRNRLDGQVGIVLAALLVLLVIIGLELLAILILNDGRLTYSLDDAYIHLALAERIALGHFGINLSEAAAPSSSIIWPFLQLPFLLVNVGDYGPLVINVTAAMATLLIYSRVGYLALCPCRRTRTKGFLLATILLLIPLTNLVGLVFTGMEHSLQLFLSSLVVLGMIEESRDGVVRWWLVAAIILVPLVRYESLALSLPALLYLAMRGHTRLALTGTAIMAALILAYGLFLRTLGLNPLPNSLLAKSYILWSGGRVEAILGNLRANIMVIEGLLFILLLVLLIRLVLMPGRPVAERQLAGVIAMCISLHLVLGTMDGFHRYELYAWTAGCLVLIYLYRDSLRQLAQGKPAYRIALALLLLAIVAGRQYAAPLFTTPFGANNIYQQQFQMHRFATAFYREPVAVVDLGRVAYENESFVLDLWGLASPAALQHRRSGGGPDWMNDLAMEKDVKLAMIYDFRFVELPQNWRPVGSLHLGRRRTSAADDSVTFYALDEATAQQLHSQLEAFRQTLPPGVTFHFANP